MRNPDAVDEFADTRQEALLNALEASKRAFLSAKGPDRCIAKQSYQNALREFSEYVMPYRHRTDAKNWLQRPNIYASVGWPTHSAISGSGFPP
jgi:hypothetical protein